MEYIRRCILILALSLALTVSAGEVVINVMPVDGDATETIRIAIEEARQSDGAHKVVIRFDPGHVYNLSREAASKCLYHVSNTTSEEENPSPVKHIGVWLRGLSNIEIDGQGATLLTHGEMTTWVIDDCRNIAISNLTVDAADPSVPEMTVTEVDSHSLTARVHASSNYELRDGKLYWKGQRWEFTGGIAQIYDHETATTRRCVSPLTVATHIEEISPGILKFHLKRKPDVRIGQTYQMRHSLRTEVAGLIVGSDNVKLSNLNLNFMGNFGIVAQNASNLTYHNIMCAPDSLSGRTCAGFADFIQISGCCGKVDISGCRFNGSQDDPINIHGTHLKVTDWGDGSRVVVKYMHPQTFGFQSFFKGDSIEIVNPDNLLPVADAIVVGASMIDERNIELLLDRQLAPDVCVMSAAVVENISRTPEVRIADCSFSATPTRAILVSTRRKVLIENNLFERIPMASILIADDGKSWYESGRVTDVTIRSNRFVDCSVPVIKIAPEISEYAGPVHRNIKIEDNVFEFCDSPEGDLIYVRASEDVRVKDNTVTPDQSSRAEP